MSERKLSDDVFDSRVQDWQQYLDTPWARIRYEVVAGILDEHCQDLSGASRPLRILDFGGGDGMDSLRLAALGHDVTLVDSSAAMLSLAESRAEGAAGSRLHLVHGGTELLGSAALPTNFDVVLCHFVVQYISEPAALVPRLSATARPGGLLSLIAPNPASDVLTAAVREVDPALAMSRLHASTLRTATFGVDVHKIPVEEGRRWLESAGCTVLQHYGIRVIIDLIADEEAKRDPQTYAAIRELERMLCDKSPYRDIARAWHLIARC